jgi:hypothetical protein
MGSALQGFFLTVGADFLRVIAGGLDTFCKYFTSFAGCG